MKILLHNDKTYDLITGPIPEGAWRRGYMLGGLVEVYKRGPRPRRTNAREVALLTLGAVVVSAAFLLALPFVIAVLGAIAPFAVVALFVRWVWRTRR